MNNLAVLPHWSAEMRSWMKDQLILEHPPAQIVSEFMERYPEFGAGLAEEVIKKRLKSRIKQMQSRGKEREEIIAGRKALKAADSKEGSVLSQTSLDNRRVAFLERMEEIDWLLSNDKTLSPEQRKALNDEFKRKHTLRQQLDAAERSEHRQQGGGSNVGWPIKLPTLHTPDPAEEKKPTPALPPPKEPEPTEPQWDETPDPDVEHFTV